MKIVIEQHANGDVGVGVESSTPASLSQLVMLLTTGIQVLLTPPKPAIQVASQLPKERVKLSG